MPRKLTVSEQLRQHIRQVDSSQRQLAFKIGVDPAVLSKFLNGQSGLSLEVIDRLGELLELTVTSAKTTGKAFKRRKGK